MACYISSNNNRFYVALEEAFGDAGAITAMNRIPAVQLAIRERRATPTRRDKTGTRTQLGYPVSSRTSVDYDLTTYLASWADREREPGYGPLFRACLGGAPLLASGGTVSSSTPDGRVTFSAAHGLTAGQAVAFGSEIRFVMAVVDGQAVQLNVPFSMAPGAGTTLEPTVTYRPTTVLPSVSVYDYWSPAEMVQRMIAGGGVNALEIEVNGDFHSFRFSGPARELLDSSSFTAGQGSLTEYPSEPAEGEFDYTLVPGHLGQAWLGSAPTQFFTLTQANIRIENSMDMRASEFGTDKASCLAPGDRKVEVSFALYSKSDEETKALYQAARQRSPISVMLQLGQESGQLFGIYIKSVLLEVPKFDDREARLQWDFGPSLAQGSGDDEVYLAFA